MAFIPDGYDTIQVASGDLNKDGVADAVLALKRNDEEQLEEEEQRLLVVLFKAGSMYKLAGKSATTLMCRQCGGVHGDPYNDISIVKGVLVVNHYGGSAWRWVDTQKFRYQGGAFYLIGATYDFFTVNRSCDGGIGEAGRKYKDINYVTGDQEVIERDEDCKLLKHLKTKTKIKPLVKLEAFKY